MLHPAGQPTTLARRESLAPSFRSEVPSTTGGNSVYQDAESGASFASSQATFRKSETLDSESFADAQMGLGSNEHSSNDLTSVPGQPPLGPAAASAAPSNAEVPTSNASAPHAQATPRPTPTGTMTSNPSTIRPTVLPTANPSPSASEKETKSSVDEKRTVPAATKKSKKKDKDDKGEEVIVDELSTVTNERWRKVLQDQMYVDPPSLLALAAAFNFRRRRPVLASYKLPLTSALSCTPKHPVTSRSARPPASSELRSGSLSPLLRTVCNANPTLLLRRASGSFSASPPSLSSSSMPSEFSPPSSLVS